MPGLSDDVVAFDGVDACRHVALLRQGHGGLLLQAELLPPLLASSPRDQSNYHTAPRLLGEWPYNQQRSIKLVCLPIRSCENNPFSFNGAALFLLFHFRFTETLCPAFVTLLNCFFCATVVCPLALFSKKLKERLHCIPLSLEKSATYVRIPFVYQTTLVSSLVTSFLPAIPPTAPCLAWPGC